jgi:phenylalanyl-tRNA synthetase alpha chain
MQQILSELQTLKETALSELENINALEQLESWRITYLGKKSKLTDILRSLSIYEMSDRKLIGSTSNSLKVILEAANKEKKMLLEEATLTNAVKQQLLDITLPGYKYSTGRLHPTTQILEQICDIFSNMGFQIAEGPDVEWDHYNFDLLNIPKDHPARDMFDTFWIDTGDDEEYSRLLRTHTSPMQIRVMEKEKPPIRVIVPGRTYRYEATDATHESMFYQVEGLAVDTNVTMADLKGTLMDFCQMLFGKDTKVRFRCDYFPFVEPGAEVAIECTACHGAGCRLCGFEGWLEILGSGMVHPDVLRNVGIDPDVYSGFAFGLGVERIPILKSGINDIRHFYNNDLRFLKQF